MLAMVVLLAIVYNIPSFFEHDIRNVSNDCLATVEPQLVYSSMRTNKLYFILYKTLIYFLFRFLFPLACLTYLNARLVYILRRQFSQQQQLLHPSSSPETVDCPLSEVPRPNAKSRWSPQKLSVCRRDQDFVAATVHQIRQ